MSTRRTRRILIAVTFCVTFCGVAMSAMTPFAVTPVAPTAEQNQSLALAQARTHCVDALTNAVGTRTDLTEAQARKVAGERCELLFMDDPISKLTGTFDKT